MDGFHFLSPSMTVLSGQRQKEVIKMNKMNDNTDYDAL